MKEKIAYEFLTLLGLAIGLGKIILIIGMIFGTLAGVIYAFSEPAGYGKEALIGIQVTGSIVGIFLALFIASELWKYFVPRAKAALDVGKKIGSKANNAITPTLIRRKAKELKANYELGLIDELEYEEEMEELRQRLHHN